MLSFVNVRGVFEGTECSVTTGPMKFEPLMPWKPEGASEKLKKDDMKVHGGPEGGAGVMGTGHQGQEM